MPSYMIYCIHFGVKCFLKAWELSAKKCVTCKMGLVVNTSQKNYTWLIMYSNPFDVQPDNDQFP